MTPRTEADPTAVATAIEAIGRATTLEELLDGLQEHAHRLVDATVFLVGLFDPRSSTVEVVRQVDRGAVLPRGSFPLGTGFTSEAIRKRLPQRIEVSPEGGAKIQVLYGSDNGDLTPPRSGVSVPIVRGARVLGVISVQSYEADAYSDADVAVLRILAAHSGLAMEQLRGGPGRAEDERSRLGELEAVIASVTDALLIVDANGAVVRLNAAARALLGPAGILLGRPIAAQRTDQWPLAARDVVEALARMVDELRAGHEIRDQEIELQRGELRVLSFSGAPMRGDGDVVTGGVLLFRDVTTRREVDRLKDEMLSTTSHELKTPLTALSGRAQLLARRASGLPPEKVAEEANAIVAQVRRLSGLIDVLTDVSALHAGRLAIARRPTDLAALVREVAEGIQATTEIHQVRVHGEPTLIGDWDERRLAQLVQNLAANAVKYSPAGGVIDITVKREGDEAIVSVCDEGVGLSAPELQRIFERAYRGRGAEHAPGQGLGLYICQGIVAAHGGRIWAESEGQSKGSTFWFGIPMTDRSG